MRPPAPWTIEDVELAEGAPSLAPDDGRPRVVQFRWRGALLGRAHLLPSDLPLSGPETARLAATAIAPAVLDLLRLEGRDGDLRRGRDRPLASGSLDTILPRLDAALAKRRSRPATPAATIAICTRNRPDDLRDCLAAIAAEAKAGHEVLVVDNGTDPRTETVAREAGARYEVEKRSGLNNARNLALHAATGEVVAFIDDDVRPEPGWLDALLGRFDEPDIALVCGLVLPEALQTEAQIGFQYDLGFGGMGFRPLAFGLSFVKLHPIGAPVWDIGAGANMAVRRELALSVGGFDGRIGAGASGAAGDDSEFWHNLLWNGFEARYEPLSVVRHRHRRSMPELRRQAYAYACGHVVALFASYARSGEPGELMRAFVFLPVWYAYRIARAPGRWLYGDPDRLLFASIGGYLGSFRHLRFIRRRAPRAAADAAPAADRPAERAARRDAA